eukprot:2151816-Amphidinium_carterae.1
MFSRQAKEERDQTIQLQQRDLIIRLLLHQAPLIPRCFSPVKTLASHVLAAAGMIAWRDAVQHACHKSTHGCGSLPRT